MEFKIKPNYIFGSHPCRVGVKTTKETLTFADEPYASLHPQTSREEEVANEVEFASFLRKCSELIVAGSPENIKCNILPNTIFRDKPISMQAVFA